MTLFQDNSRTLNHEWPATPVPVIVVGPTAVGKTDVAVEIALRLNGEIINADSMQVYRGMDIGTAKPTGEARRRVPFHLLDIKSPDEPFSVSEWKRQAEAAICDVVARGHRPIVCGGTGMYIRALLDDWTLGNTPAHPEIRELLRTELQAGGSLPLHARLKAVDPEAATRLHPHDGVRIVRALEVFLATGVPISECAEQDRRRNRRRLAIQVGLTLPRPDLYARIESRVDRMIDLGFVEEVDALLNTGVSAEMTPMRSLGYKEIVAHLREGIDRDTTVRTIKQNTRRYAKRQQTWFRADHEIAWTDVSAMNSAEVADNLIVALRAQSQ